VHNGEMWGGMYAPSCNVSLQQYSSYEQDKESEVHCQVDVTALHQRPSLDLMNGRRHVKQIFSKQLVFLADFGHLVRFLRKAESNFQGAVEWYEWLVFAIALKSLICGARAQAAAQRFAMQTMRSFAKSRSGQCFWCRNPV
jgi:hypothetical protein